MTYDEFIKEYYEACKEGISCLLKCRFDGLLSFEEDLELNIEKINKRDVFWYGMHLVINGTDPDCIKLVLSNIIDQENDVYTRKLMNLKKEAVISILYGENPWVFYIRLNSYTDLPLDDKNIKKLWGKEFVPLFN